MRDDDELCLCFHVTRRKVEQYLRVHQPPHASQLSECFGAGTGCGWCRPFLRRLHERAKRGFGDAAASAPDAVGVPEMAEGSATDLPDAEAYAMQRKAYRQARDGTAPAGDGPP